MLEARNTLVEFLIKEDEKAGRKALAEFSKLDDHGPMQFGTESAPQSPVSRSQILLEAAVASLERAVGRFSEVREKIENRIGRASTLRLWAAVITTILSSSVVASLSNEKTSSWGIVLGVLAIVASLLTLVAGRLEGGETNVAQQFGEVAGFHAEALELLDRLRGYLRAPDLFKDVDDRVTQAAGLIKELEIRRARWLQS